MEVMYRYHRLLLWTLIILVFVTIAKTQTDSLLFCNEIVYVEYGKRAIIPCTCEPGFDVISWFKDGDYTNLQPPFIYLDAAGKHGTGYDSNEFDLDQNGTLTIRNVSLSHDECFAVKAIKSSAKLSVVRRVHVTVVWGPHDPVYPVVNGLIHQQHVYMDVNRNGALTCSLYNVHPVVNLTWGVIDPSHLGKIDIHDVGMRNTPNVDGTFNVLLDSQYVVADLTIRRIAIECKVTDEMSEYFAETTKVELLFPTGFPIVNGHVNQQHVYLDTQRKGKLNCAKKNVRPSAHLGWEVVDPASEGKIKFQSETNRSQNMDGTVDIFLTSDFTVDDDRLERITLHCRVFGGTENDFNATTVDLLFPDVFPAVNGLINQQHVYLDTYRKGKLNCSKRNVSPSAHIRWEVVDPASEGKIKFQSEINRSENIDGTVDIFLTSDFTVDDDRLERITLQCRVLGGTENEYATTVDLLFPDALPVPPAPPVPVIDGCYNQQDACVLRRQRRGELACGVLKSQQQVELKWKCNKDGVIFKDDKKIVKNNSDVFDVSILTQYEIKDEALELVTIQCDVVGWRGEAPPVAKVSLILEKAESGLEFKVNILLALMLFQLLLLICFIIFVSVRVARMRKLRKKLEIFLNGDSKGSGDFASDVARTEATELQVQVPLSCVSQTSEAHENQETAALITANGGIGHIHGDSGQVDSDSGKGSGSDSGSDENNKIQFTLGGKVVTNSSDNEEKRPAKDQRLAQTILRTFQLLYDKYLSRECEIEETVALISEEEKKGK